MGLARSNSAPLRTRRQASAWTSVGTCAILFTLWVALEGRGIEPGAEELLERAGGAGKTPGIATASSSWPRATDEPDEPGRRLDSVPLDDLIIDKPYRSSTNRGWVFLHVIGIGYMLLGLNTVCDIYFTGSLEVMVEKWNIKPDVAGATFMAAGGSAPELCTSFIGTLVVKNDVGFGTIVGSAVFNVLFVIGLCGFLSSGEIKLTWWPLFRDCTYYLCGLGLLAAFASDEKIVLWEAIVLFVAYLLYCTIMYNNAKFEALMDTEFQRAKRASITTTDTAFNAVHPEQAPKVVIGAWEAPSEKTYQSPDQSGDEAVTPEEPIIGETGQTPNTPNQLQVPHSNPVTPCPADQRNHEERSHSHDGTWPSRAVTRHGSGAQVAGKMRGSYILGHVVAERHEIRMASLGNHSGDGSRAAFSSEGNHAKTHPEHHQPSVREEAEEQNYAQPSTGSCEPPGDAPILPLDSEDGDVEKQQEEGEKKEEEKEGDNESDEGDLMTRPEGTVNTILWVLSLPVYVPLHYLTIQPSESLFMLTFVQSLCWIAGFNFLLVWWVEILGEVCHIHYIVMSLTVLAAGTSIPDLVSSVAVARMGEGDMAISSSIGSNIFDILVGLPLPWIIKTGFVDGGSTVNIISPFLTFHVLLLLFMVFAVILCIHCLGWKLNKTLGLMMAVLYAIFLAVAIVTETTQPTALMF